MHDVLRSGASFVASSASMRVFSSSRSRSACSRRSRSRPSSSFTVPSSAMKGANKDCTSASTCACCAPTAKACLWESNSARIGYRLRTKPLGALIRPRPQQNRLRPFTVDERAHLEHLSRSYTAPARHVARAKALLPVADGCRFTHHLLRAA